MSTFCLKRDQEKWNPVFRPIVRPARNREQVCELQCFIRADPARGVFGEAKAVQASYNS